MLIPCEFEADMSLGTYTIFKLGNMLIPMELCNIMSVDGLCLHAWTLAAEYDLHHV